MDKKVPLRMCIVCRQMLPKEQLVRVVKVGETGCRLDVSGKMSGRGAYICSNSVCMDKLIKTRALSRAFKVNVPQEVYDTIIGDYAAIKN